MIFCLVIVMYMRFLDALISLHILILVYIFRANKTAWTIIAREQAPAAATEDMYVPEGVSSTVGRLQGH